MRKVVAVLFVLLIMSPGAAAIQPSASANPFLLASWNPFSKEFWSKDNGLVQGANDLFCGGEFQYVAGLPSCPVLGQIKKGADATYDFIYETVSEPVVNAVHGPPPAPPQKSDAELCIESNGQWISGGCQYNPSNSLCSGYGLNYDPASQSCVARLTEAATCNVPGYYYGPDGVCYETRQSYEATACQQGGGYWTGSSCKTQAQIEQEACLDNGNYWSGSECWVSQEQYQAASCAEQGLVLYEGSCRTTEFVAETECGNQGHVYSVDHGCLQKADIGVLCDNLGYVWVADNEQCFVMESNQVPRGLEGYFVAARNAQEKALVGSYVDKVNLLLQTHQGELETSLQNQADELNEFYQAEVDRIEAEFEEALETQRVEYEEALAEYRSAYEGLLEVVSVITERIKAKYYFDKDTSPGGAFTALRRMVGVQGGQIADASFAFPHGFPTPTDKGDAWLVRVPLEVSFPRVPLESGEIIFEADTLVYAVSADGGETFTTASLPVDFVGGGTRHDKVVFNLQATIEKSSTNHDLAVYAGLYYVEHYEFGPEGYIFDLDSYRESDALERRFYTSNNPFTSGAGTVTTTGSTDGDVVCLALDCPKANESGTSPGGAAGFYNWAAEQNARAQSVAQDADAQTGFGFSLLLSYWYVPVLVIGGFVAYWRGWLDFIGPVRRMRRKKEKDPFGLDGLDLNDDLLGGI